MSKDFLYSVIGAAIGSVIEEFVEDSVPGMKELGFTGEIGGAITGLLTSKLSKEELKNATNVFFRYAYKVTLNKKTNEITDDELEAFSKSFQALPKKNRHEIVRNFKSLSPYEYGLIKDMLINIK